MPNTTAAVSLLRAVNLGSYNKIKMDALRELYCSLGLLDCQTYIQSGNVVFRAKQRDLAAAGRKIEDAIERNFGFRTEVIIRTAAELRDVIARNPFAKRRDIEPAKLVVTFLAGHPTAEGSAKVRSIRSDLEEIHLDGRELYIYFPNGMGRTKLPMPAINKALGSGTARNWNTVLKLLEMAERLG
jgi:uncharacterized protein (DUF1697 family)